MTWFEALILGILQGLTEFLPISSSGHLELGKAILGVDAERSLIFTVVVHGATVMSTIVVFYREIGKLFRGVAAFRWNEETRYVALILVSLIPVLVVGFFFRDFVESLFNGNIVFVGSMLLVTAVLLFSTHIRRNNRRDIGFMDAFIIGIAQMLAVVPGISRSGATISTGLLLGNKKEDVARFSFLMVLIPIIGANLMDILNGNMTQDGGIGALPLLIGFFAAFFSGWLACSWMINIVKKGKLYYFGIYCVIAGVIAIVTA